MGSIRINLPRRKEKTIKTNGERNER